jgi:hypothetical protein
MQKYEKCREMKRKGKECVSVDRTFISLEPGLGSISLGNTLSQQGIL